MPVCCQTVREIARTDQVPCHTQTSVRVSEYLEVRLRLCLYFHLRLNKNSTKCEEVLCSYERQRVRLFRRLYDPSTRHFASNQGRSSNNINDVEEGYMFDWKAVLLYRLDGVLPFQINISLNFRVPAHFWISKCTTPWPSLCFYLRLGDGTRPTSFSASKRIIQEDKAASARSAAGEESSFPKRQQESRSSPS